MIPIRRPLVWILAGWIILFYIYRALYSQEYNARFYVYQNVWEEESPASALGDVKQITFYPENKSQQIILRHVQVQLSDKRYASQVQSFPLLLVYLPEDYILKPGQRIQVSGKIQEIEKATNPGQFDLQEYYQQKKIYYQFQASQCQIINEKYAPYQNMLYQLRSRFSQVYQCTLSQENAGIVQAMLLGEKNMLDTQIKELYQKNGIGHILAISGLHVTLLGLGLFRLLRYLHLSLKSAIMTTILFLYSYGLMTNFSISTSRAVIMMILMLMAQRIGRTYDQKSAIACSAMILLIQRPLALYSCGFLLSFGATAAIAWLGPACKITWYGTAEQQRKKKRRYRVWKKETLANHRYGKWIVTLSRKKKNMMQLLLTSYVVNLGLLPFLLYFYYEIPIYSIFLNLLILPLASLLVILSALGGIAGVFFLPFALPFMWLVTWILSIYKTACQLVIKLPGHLLILGKPHLWQMVLYFCLLLFFLLLIRWKAEEVWVRHLRLVPLLFCLLFLIPHQSDYLELTAIDVGQGDGIFWRTPSGSSYLLDGGSSSCKNVGVRRILPFLKSQGISCLDYVIVSHEDSDHISGIQEILQLCIQKDYHIRHLIMPDIANPQDGYLNIVAMAQKASIPITYLKAGGVLQEEGMALTCMNPVSGMMDDSANAGSIVLQLQYGSFQALLTGDMEGAGEEQVMQILRQRPTKFDLLKVAHHGSKNSSSEEFLELVQMSHAWISSGKANRYGHPHQELLDRLQAFGCYIDNTASQGALFLQTDGQNIQTECFCKEE